jgi:hypothetical protein
MTAFSARLSVGRNEGQSVRPVGGDGWESNPPGTGHRRPSTILKTAEGTSPRTSPLAE